MYDHKEYVDGTHINDNPHTPTCPFCKGRLIATEIPDNWPISDDEILNVHQDVVEAFKEIHDLEDCYLNLKLETADFKVLVQYCWTCGWWRMLKRIRICAEEWQIWEFYFGCAGSLKNFDQSDIGMPLMETRDFIARNYVKRYTISPRLFENLVASVFKSLGYNTVVTGYTHDGGIDIVLTNSNNNTIGVQVTRSKRLVTVKQIREFVGSLSIAGIPKGVYVTASSFTSSAVKISGKLAFTTAPIRLINASTFYDALKIAQVNDKNHQLLPFNIDNYRIPHINFYGWENPMNSL